MLKSTAIINPRLLAALADLRHGDVLVIADAGMPVGEAERVVDLSLVPGTPSFAAVAEAILQALVVESAVVAQEAHSCAPVLALRERLTATEVTHEELIRMTRSARAVVRTGEQTPYANVALVAGVPF